MHILIDIVRNSIMITGLVVIMMMMIESLNIESKGLFFKGLKKTRFGQVVIGAMLGSIPGCMGGFATVSLYTHRMFSFGALVAMMIASSGDEAFIMLAMIPQDALILFAILFVIAIIVGYSIDAISAKRHSQKCDLADHSNCGVETECQDGYHVHNHIENNKEEQKKKHFGWKRITMFIGLAIFIAALATGHIGHDHSAHTHDGHAHSVESDHHINCNHEHSTCHPESSTCHPERSEGSLSFNILDEQWMNILFAGLSVIILFVLIFASDHFVEEHLWRHIIKKHLPVIFGWTFGVLLILGFGLQYVNIKELISDNTALMILLATLIGIIPESGPQMLFVILFATGAIPFPVLLANSISQDGHASIPLLAESKKSFLWAKIINCGVALVAGYTAMFLM